MEALAAILAELEKTQKHALAAAKLRKLGLSTSAAELISRIGAQEISGSYIIQNYANMVADNEEVPFIPKGWITFAKTGSGDFWLLPRSGEDDVAFLDHDQESKAVAQPMGITLGQWVQLAWFKRRLREEGRADRGNVEARKKREERERAFVRELAPGFADRYPFRIG